MLRGFVLCLNCLVFSAGLEYQQVFLPDPKVVLEGTRPEGSPENVALLEGNKAWINDRTGKEVTKRMINVRNTMPITPHGVYKYVDDSPYCWVMLAYDSDEDVVSEILETAQHLSDYFYERCAVGTLDMAYPSNKFTFGYLIEDMPMLLVKKAGRNNKMLQDYIEQDSFVLKDRRDWGKRVMTDDLEDDINGELKKIIDQFYEPMTDFVKLTTIHIQWYGHLDQKKAESQAAIKDHVTELAKGYEAEKLELKKHEFFDKIQETFEDLKSKLDSAGHQTVPKPLPKTFGDDIWRDEL